MPSGAGSGVNEVLDKCVREGKGAREEGGGKKNLQCVLHKQWSREKKSDQRPRGYKCQTCQGSNL